jgi:carboxypeptidase Q
MRYFLLIPGLFMVASAAAQTEDSVFIRRIADEVLTHGKAYDNLRVLTKHIGGRLSGSPQMVAAEAWGLKAIKEAGADKAWLQECIVPHWVRGGKDKATASYNTAGPKAGASFSKPQSLQVAALGNSVGTGPVPVSAEVVEVANFDELEQKKDLLKGKIVFYNYHFNPTFVKTFNAYADAVRYRGGGPSRAAQYGAKAVVVRSMSEGDNNFPHTGSTVYNDSFPKIPAVAIGLQDADWLSNAIQRYKKVNLNISTQGRFLPDTIGHNVIGELRGTQFPDEYITIGGHLDSWDLAEGAHDDGAGVVHTIEVLRVLKALGYRPKHTIRFVLFANEENGTRGGRKYAEEAKARGEKHILALESDEGGFTPRGFGISGSEAQYAKIAGWKDLLVPYGAGEITRGGGGSDIGFLTTTLGTPTAGFTPDSQRYFDLHHAANDVFENVNRRELELGAVNIAALVYLLDKYGL